MDWILIIISSSYLIFVSLLIIGWRRLPAWDLNSRNDLSVSVIIPVRDEAGNIDNVLDDLEAQSYPIDHFEVIIVDDNSTDNTYSRLMERLQQTKLNMKILKAPVSDGIVLSPKKIAITHGIENATGEIILLMDGDARIGAFWIQSYASIFTNSAAMFVSGPVVMKSKHFMEELQAIEFASLVGTGAACIAFNMPSMCNGANLGFRRKAFMKVGGYKSNEEIISGDDEFLMYKIHTQFHSRVRFLKSIHSVAGIQPLYSFKAFYRQRRRWSGKWRKHVNPTSMLLALYIFIVHLVFLLMVIGGLLKSISIQIVFIIWAAKIILEYFFLRSIMNYFGRRMKIAPFILSSLLYSLYAVNFGILSNMGGFEWKGRKFKD